MWRIVFPIGGLVALCVVAGVVAQDEPSPAAASSFSMQVGPQVLIVECHKQGARYSLEGNHLILTANDAKPITFTVGGGTVSVDNDGFRVEAPNLKISRDGAMYAEAWVEGNAPVQVDAPRLEIPAEQGVILPPPPPQAPSTPVRPASEGEPKQKPKPRS